jgi:hypothetical protein
MITEWKSSATGEMGTATKRQAISSFPRYRTHETIAQTNIAQTNMAWTKMAQPSTPLLMLSTRLLMPSTRQVFDGAAAEVLRRA